MQYIQILQYVIWNMFISSLLNTSRLLNLSNINVSAV